MPPDLQPPQMPTDPVHEARILQADQHHQEMGGQLDTIIHQNEQNNPVPPLEAIMHQNEAAQKTMADAGSKVAEAIASLKPDVAKMSSATDAMAAFLHSMKGDKGDKGEQGIQGEKGDQGAASTVPGPKGDDGLVGPRGMQGDRGADGPEGPAGRDGRDGRDGAVGPRGPHGLKGDMGSDTGVEIVAKLAGLTKDERLSYSALKDTPDLFRRLASRDYAFLELTDVPKTYVGQSGKTVKVKTDESGLEFVTGGGGGSGVTYISGQQSGMLPQGETVYVGNGQTFDDEYPLFVARVASSITELMVMSITGNGGGHTDTYTVYKNGVATTMVLTVLASTNGQIKSTLLNPVILAIGDRIAVRVVCDAATVAANTLIQLTVTPS